jgi:membrane-bound lytic murein transglycosylase F
VLEIEAKTEPVDFDLEKIIERGTVIGIVENSTTGYFVYKGQILGYEYELLKSFADYLGVDLELKVTSNLQEAVEMMESGGGDIMAYPLTVTKERRKRVLFTDYHYTIRMMLIQRYPDNWSELKAHELENSLLRNQVDLIGKDIHVRYRSSYIQRLSNLSEEIGGDIVIVETGDNLETEDLIRQVSNGDIEYTIADEHIALVNATYYQNIDVKTPISFPTQIAWALRSNSPELRDTINIWLKKIKREPTFNVIYNKYFQNTKAALSRKRSDFLSVGGGSISEYDSLIRKGAIEIDWDWRLLASQIYQESKFDPRAKSWAGAMGLMQLVPITAKEYGANDPYDPIQNLNAGVKYLQWLQSYWEPRLERQDDLIQFILASYNVGLGHVLDARRLTTKYKGDPEVWSGNVEKYLQLKSKPRYYDDPVVKLGYCRGDEPVNYVRDIFARYNQYTQVFPADDPVIESDSVSTTL